MKFVKAHCGANDFIILDSRKNKVPKNSKKFIPQWTNRRTGIGADGVIVIEPSKDMDFGLRYFNPDGSEYAVCGDGSLCAVLYEGKKEVSFSTLAGMLRGSLTNNKVKVEVPSPRDVKLCNLNIRVDESLCSHQVHTKLGIEARASTYTTKDSPPYLNKGKKIECNFVDIWVPHTIIFVRNVELVDINREALPVRFHSYFGSEGTNVNFVQVINEHKIAVRTYERGVEGETLSCGSGSCASCIVGWLKKKLMSPIEVKTRIGKLVVYINSQRSTVNSQQLTDIWLEGSPEIVYEGEIKILGKKAY